MTRQAPAWRARYTAVVISRSRAALVLPDALAGEGGREYAASPGRLLPGHRLEPLVDGDEAFPRMLEAIGRARDHVHLETYIFEEDRIGSVFVDALSQKAREGVAVRLLVDGFGSFGLSWSFFAELERAGVAVAVYGKLSGRRWRRWLRRDHRKILVVDGRIAFAGGLNIGDDYAPRRYGGKGWRDTHIKLEGPAVADLDEMFRATWDKAGGEPYPAYPRRADESVAAAGTELAAALATDDGGRRSVIRRHYLHAIRRARELVYVCSGYFVPDRAIRRALVAAARRGVSVEIILPAESDLRAVQWAGEHLYARLVAGGVRVFRYRERNMHAKTIVVDGVWSAIGSYNLDYVSLFQNMEVSITVVGERTGEKMRRMFEADRDACDEVELAAWRRRRWWLRAIQWFAYRFRRWL